MSKKKSNQFYSKKTDNQNVNVVNQQQYFFSSDAHNFGKPAQDKQLKKVKDYYLLIGTPNVGKSTFFNKVSKSTANVSNIDRLTTSSTVGKIKKHKNKVIVDLPGIYNLSHPIDEEVVVAKQICDSKFKKIINIIGAQSIQRDLLLSIQAIETGLMSTLIINMVDEVNHESLDIDKFSKCLSNIKIIKVMANKNVGIKESINSILKDKTVDPKVVKYDQLTESCVEKISKILPDSKISKRFYALMILENNRYVIEAAKNQLKDNYQKIQDVLDEYKDIDFTTSLRNQRTEYIEKILNKCIKKLPDKNYFQKINKTRQRKVDRVILNG
jgi:ferrous iron transport protein B